ncbi:MAG: hypothetical protein HQK52_18535 [Oligoflexia bacterium]|nr:hypothetical protein [Oligoflexia bacterium]
MPQTEVSSLENPPLTESNDTSSDSDASATPEVVDSNSNSNDPTATPESNTDSSLPSTPTPTPTPISISISIPTPISIPTAMPISTEILKENTAAIKSDMENMYSKDTGENNKNYCVMKSLTDIGWKIYSSKDTRATAWGVAQDSANNMVPILYHDENIDFEHNLALWISEQSKMLNDPRAVSYFQKILIRPSINTAAKKLAANANSHFGRGSLLPQETGKIGEAYDMFSTISTEDKDRVLERAFNNEKLLIEIDILKKKAALFLSGTTLPKTAFEQKIAELENEKQLRFEEGLKKSHEQLQRSLTYSAKEPSRLLDAFYQEYSIYDCAGGVQTAAYATLKELLGNSSFDKLINGRHRLVMSDEWGHLLFTDDLFFGSKGLNTIPISGKKQIQERGMYGLIAQSGAITRENTTVALSSANDQNENYIIVDIDQKAFDWFVDSLNDEVGSRRTNFVPIKLQEITIEYYKKRKAGDREGAHDLIFNNPFLAGTKVYVFPLGVRTFAYHIERLYTINPQTAYYILFYGNDQERLYREIFNSKVNECMNP